jgi:very-short-patch-repair endonuclease
MADVMRLSNETEDYKYHNNNILCKHFDFVICEKRKFEPLLVIELDDPKHQFLHRKQVDIFKEKACKEAGLKFLRFEVKDQYGSGVAEQIRQKLAISGQENE